MPGNRSLPLGPLAVLLLARSFVAAAAPDPLNRSSPQASVTRFLQICQGNNYVLAAEYLDLARIPERERAANGPRLARQMEAVLNADSEFVVLRLSQNTEGNPTDDTSPAIEHIASVTREGRTLRIDLIQENLKPGVTAWLFSPESVAQLPIFADAVTTPDIESRLPLILVSATLLETPLWKWLALFFVAALILVLARLSRRAIMAAVRRLHLSGPSRFQRLTWLNLIVNPCLVLLGALLFAFAEQIIRPSALSRLYIGRGILLVVIGSFARCCMNLVEVSLVRIESLLDPKQRMVSHSMLHLGRRTLKIAVIIIGAIVVFDNWGYNMSTMIAGLGVGGIALALAAQSTISNVFGGVSVIGDHPVMVGDFGNFGGVLGTIEDIGMRSTRVRTLNRTMMSIPNSAFAAMNLENYTLRDKILFNPTLNVKRIRPKEVLRGFLESLESSLRADPRMEIAHSPVRLSGLTATSFVIELFAYACTADIDEFYKIEVDLLLTIDDLLAGAGLELV